MGGYVPPPPAAASNTASAVGVTTFCKGWSVVLCVRGVNFPHSPPSPPPPVFSSHEVDSDLQAQALAVTMVTVVVGRKQVESKIQEVRGENGYAGCSSLGVGGCISEDDGLEDNACKMGLCNNLTQFDCFLAHLMPWWLW